MSNLRLQHVGQWYSWAVEWSLISEPYLSAEYSLLCFNIAFAGPAIWAICNAFLVLYFYCSYTASTVVLFCYVFALRKFEAIKRDWLTLCLHAPALRRRVVPPVTTAGYKRLSPALMFSPIIHGSLAKALCILNSTKDNLLYNCTDGKWQIRRETTWFSVWALASSCWIVLKSACSRLSWQHPKRHLNSHTAGEASNLRLLRNQLSQKKIVIPIPTLVYRQK